MWLYIHTIWRMGQPVKRPPQPRQSQRLSVTLNFAKLSSAIEATSLTEHFPLAGMVLFCSRGIFWYVLSKADFRLGAEATSTAGEGRSPQKRLSAE